MRALILVVFLAGCSSLNPLGFLSGGTNVAANTQLGRQNTQTIGTSTVQEFGTQTVQSERVTTSQGQTNRVSATDVQTVVVNEVPTWIILLLVLGWLFPSPGEMGRVIKGWFSGKKS